MGRGGGGDGDGGAVQRIIVHRGIIAIGGIGDHGHHRAVILLVDIVHHLLALQSSLQRLNGISVLSALLHSQNVGIGGGGALDEQGVLHGVQAGVDGVVAVDDGVLGIRQQGGQLSSLGLHDLHIVGIIHNVVLGGGDAGTVLQGDDAVLLQQQQRTGFVGGVVGDQNFHAAVGLFAAGGQTQNQYQRQSQRGDLCKYGTFHDDFSFIFFHK